MSRRIDMSSATVHDRVNRMEDAGVIEGYHATVDTESVGVGTAAFVGLRIERGRTEDALREVDGFARSHTMVIVGTDYEATGVPV